MATEVEVIHSIEQTTEKPVLEPVAEPERIAAVDTLRGFALLGILAMNIIAFALPDAAYGNPLIAGGFAGADYVAWLTNHLFFELKMMSIFSMLFGAGLVLMADRAEARGGTPRGIYYRRVLWLLVFGLAHAYLLWWGDILYSYAVCGLLLYLFRRRSPKVLITLGLLVTLVAIPLGIGFSFSIAQLKEKAAQAESAIAAGRTQQELSQEQRDALAGWNEMRANFDPTPAQLAKEIETYRGGYAGIFKHRAPSVFMFQTIFFIAFIFWRVAGMMLLGMGLMKLGVFSAKCSTRFYALCALIGYGVGLPLIAYGARELVAHQFAFDYVFRVGSYFNYVGSMLVALGHVGAVILVYQARLLTWLTTRLAAVGRMALTNYLTHSLVCTTLFYGYGFGLFGTINRAGLFGVVVAIWIFQLAVSPWWLRRFRFGPAEWVWRSLTYWRRQPMKLQAGEAVQTT